MGFLNNTTFMLKMIWQVFGQYWETFYSIIWSHWVKSKHFSIRRDVEKEARENENLVPEKNECFPPFRWRHRILKWQRISNFLKKLWSDIVLSLMVYFGIMPFPYSAQLILKSKAHPCYLMCWDEENLGSVEGPAKKLLTKKL